MGNILFTLSKSKICALRAMIVTAVISLSLTGCGIVAATSLNLLEITRFEVIGDEVHMHHEINSKTYDQFVAVHRANPGIRTIVQHDVPGSVDDETMIRLAYYVRKNGLNTKLTANSKILSGGVDLFLAGVERTVERGAVVGVHSWSDGFREAADYPRGSPEHELNRKYVEDMLGSDEFYWFTIYAAPADGIHRMTVSEIERFGLVTKPVSDRW